MAAARAVVFAYHDVGVRCLLALLSADIEIPLVVTVADDPHETRWFGSVADTAAEHDLRVVRPADPNTGELAQTLSELQPDFIFSFYYRALLGGALLRTAARGALNMHGSLLPKYRGRAPVNWAILRGEKETGATLHYMVERADAGDIVDQLAVPILHEDNAQEVFRKVTVAAETVLARSLPALLAGTAPRRSQPPAPGEYFGRRRPEDGQIDWSRSAQEIHNLVRAVAPPFPAAFTTIRSQRWWLHATRVEPAMRQPAAAAQLTGEQGRCLIICRDGSVLRLLAAVTAAGPVDLAAVAQAAQKSPVTLQ
ncbi:MAG TPA: formyltransferase [Steroidobacteraceae bacterium]|nr:formyltransferase [Steroidobacteraceae bacterium]